MAAAATSAEKSLVARWLARALADFQHLWGDGQGSLDDAPDFAAYCRLRTLALARAMLLAGAAVMVVLTPTDLLVFAHSPANRLTSWLGRLAFLVVCAGLYSATWRVSARAFVPYVVVGLTVLGTAVFGVLGASADPRAPFVFNVLYLSFLPVGFLLPLGARIAALVVPSLAGLLAFYVPNAQQWAYPYVPMVVVQVSASIVLSAVVGHLLFTVEASAFAQRRVIRQQLHELTGLNGALVDHRRLQEEHLASIEAQAGALSAMALRLNLALEAGRQGWFDGPVDGPLDINPRCAELLGLPQGTISLPIEVWRAHIHDEDRADVQAALDHHVSGETARLEVEHRVAGAGNTRWVSAVAQVVRGPDGRSRFVGTLSDVTERRRTADLLTQAYAREKALREAIPDTLIRLDGAGRVLAVHRPRSDRLSDAADGHDEGEAALVDATADALREAVRQALATGMAQSVQHTVSTSDGEHSLETRVCRVSDDELVAVRRDITPMRLMLERLNAAERLSALGRLAAGVAHEVNNPLTYILLNINMVSTAVEKWRDFEEPLSLDLLPTLLHRLGQAREGSLRVRDIVAALLTYSRQTNDDLRAVRVEDAARASVDMVRNMIQQRARLETDIQRCPPVLGTDSRLSQVMVNLLTNAAQAIPPGDPGHHVVSIVTRAAGGQVLIEVKDTGIGIPAAVQNRIFDPFFTTKPHGEGTGLGLSISLGIVQELGGTIEVTSEPGRGSTFRVLLPASALPVVEEAPADVLPEGPRRRVLIVDDDPAVAHALAGALERVHDVACAFEGREALARLGSGEPFDAVVCDLEMPGVSGMDVFEKVMAQDPSLGARFIFMTGGTFTDRARAFRERVSNTVLNKPLDSASVRRHIEAVPRA